MKRIHTIVLLAIVVIVAFAAVTRAQRRTVQPPQPSRTYTSIRQVDFKNFTYHFAGGILRVRQGKEIIRDGTDTSLERVIYGDLTGDGQDEAVVLLWQRNHVSARSEDSPYFVFTLSNGRPVALRVPELYGLIALNVEPPDKLLYEINVKSGLLVVEHGDLLHGGLVRLRNFRWAGSAFDEVDDLVLPDDRTHYLARLFGCDDGCIMKINGNEFLSTAFAENRGWIDFTEALQDGRNQIKFTVYNEGGGIAYGIRVAKNDSTIFEKICGRAGQMGCENNRMFPKGIVREFTYTIVK